jgi:hypothetical protein
MEIVVHVCMLIEKQLYYLYALAVMQFKQKLKKD